MGHYTPSSASTLCPRPDTWLTKFGKAWAIPKDAQKPEDGRKNKKTSSSNDYSPTTIYNDYSINEEPFHWQIQSTATDTGTVGQRYINHRKNGSKVLLFVREFKTDMAGTAPYTCPGTANYVKHNGNRPMNITWKLDKPIAAKYLKKTNKLVVE